MGHMIYYTYRYKGIPQCIHCYTIYIYIVYTSYSLGLYIIFIFTELLITTPHIYYNMRIIL